MTLFRPLPDVLAALLFGIYIFAALAFLIIMVYLMDFKHTGKPTLWEIAALLVMAAIWPLTILFSLIYYMTLKRKEEEGDDKK